MDDVVSQFVGEQKRLRQLLTDLINGLPGRDRWALFRFTHLARSLRQYMRLEHELLYPTFDERGGVGTGLTAALRREHGPIRELLRDIERGLAGDARNHVGSNLRELAAALDLHFKRTELVLVPIH